MFRSSLRRGVASMIVLATAAASGSLMVATPAVAAGKFYEIDYTATGSTTLTSPNSQVTVNFKPALLQSFVSFDDNGAAVKANLALAPVRASFLAYGFLPAQGTVVFTQVGFETGRLGNYDPVTGFPLSVTARYVISLRNVVIGGVNADVGSSCQTQVPITATVTAEPGFDLANGTLDGTYTLGKFINCGAASNIINDTLPGMNNALQLNISLGAPSAADAAAVKQVLTPGAAPRQ